jgi:hypothetical protein
MFLFTAYALLYSLTLLGPMSRLSSVAQKQSVSSPDEPV